MKNAFITGGAGAIGEAICRALAPHYNVIIGYNSSESKAKALSEELCCTAVRVDVADSQSVREASQGLLRDFNHIDLLVNNAGISQIKLFTDITDLEWDKMVATNLSGAFYLSRAFLPSMINRKSGSIINISSVWGVYGASCEVHYSAAKAGLIGLTKALAKEVGASGVRVNCVAPGVIDTAMNSAFTVEEKAVLVEETPLMRLGKPADVAEAVLYLAAAEFVTGQVLGVDGGFC